MLALMPESFDCGHQPMSFTYDIGEAELLRTALKFRRTVWPHVLSARAFWFFLVFHLTVWVSYRYRWLDAYDLQLGSGLMAVDWDDVKVISAITTFFEVFYTSQCYHRYFLFNHETNEVFRTGHKFAFELRIYTSPSGQAHQRIILRWLRVSLVIFFTRLRHGEDLDFCVERLAHLGLLREAEKAILQNATAAECQNYLLTWMALLITEAHDLKHITSPQKLKSLIDRLMAVSDAKKELMELVWMPVPYQYFHFLSIIICINLALWAYAMALTDSYFAPVMFCFASFIFIGMLELAKSISDPFGDDEVDFPIHTWFEKWLENQLALTEGEFPLPPAMASALGAEQRPTFTPQEVSSIISGPNRAKPQHFRPSICKRSDVRPSWATTMREARYSVIPTEPEGER